MNLFAELTMNPDVLVQYGAIGVILLWFMFRIEKKMDRHTNVISDLVESITLEVLTRANLPEHVRERAEGILERAHARNTVVRARQPASAE